MGGGDLSLAYAASSAYENADANLRFIADALDEIRPRVNIDPEEYWELMRRFRELLDVNRTAPAVMRIMALADAARIAGEELLSPSTGWLERRSWRKQSQVAKRELLAQVATTLDALMKEPI